MVPQTNVMQVTTQAVMAVTPSAVGIVLKGAVEMTSFWGFFLVLQKYKVHSI
jgi:hypothetical protein